MDNTANITATPYEDGCGYILPCGYKLPCGVCRITNTICPLSGGTWAPKWTVTSQGTQATEK